MPYDRETLKRIRNRTLDQMEKLAKEQRVHWNNTRARDEYEDLREIVLAIDEDMKTLPLSNPAVPTDNRDRFRMQMAASILLRAYGSEIDDKTAEAGREFAGLSLIEMARECLRRTGARIEGLGREQIARVALQMAGHGTEHLAGMHSTSDLPNIVEDVANKSLRKGYAAAPRTFTVFGRHKTATDFKPINRVQLSDIAALREVKEHGEFKRRTLSDSKETYTLRTYGDIVGITRRTIVNDELGALTRVPEAFGVAAATMESDVVYDLILANAAMNEDNKAIFHADHGNLHYSNPFDDDGLAVVRTGMRLRTAPNGTILNLTPRYVIAPAALEQEVERVVSPLGLAASSADNVIPGWMRSLIPVIEPRLDADSEVDWYMAADPNLIEGLEYCYLEGQDGVQIEVRPGFNIDGLEIKAFEDFAAGIVDHRGFSKSTTAAAP